MSQTLRMLGNICVGCTAIVIGVLAVVSLATLIWVALL